MSTAPADWPHNEVDDFGVFPFGKLNTIRPARLVARSEAVVIGVYPSAWHIEWHAPARLRGIVRYGRVAALAVDVEPEPFWEGRENDFVNRVQEWKRDVGFIDGVYGTVGEREPSMNGSTGRLLARHILEPLGLDPARTTCTDAFPAFMVKYRQAPRQPRQQGDAMLEEYEPVARALGLVPCALKRRLLARALPAEAARLFGARLTEVVLAAQSDLVITVGEEAWETVRDLKALDARSPVRRFDDLKGAGYGARGLVKAGGREAEWLPLVHPSWLQLKRAQLEWPLVHARWLSTVVKK